MLAPALGFVLYEAPQLYIGSGIPGARETIHTLSILLLPFLQKFKLRIPASAAETASQARTDFFNTQSPRVDNTDPVSPARPMDWLGQLRKWVRVELGYRALESKYMCASSQLW